MESPSFQEQLEKLLEQYKILSAQVHNGDLSLNLEIYNERGKVIGKIDELTAPRIRKITEIIKTLPDGRWNDDDFWRIDNQFFRAGRKFNDLKCEKIRFSSLFYHGGDVYLEYAFCIGFDDGYPEEESLYVLPKWVYEEDEDKLKIAIYDAAFDVCTQAALKLTKYLCETNEIKSQILAAKLAIKEDE